MVLDGRSQSYAEAGPGGYTRLWRSLRHESRDAPSFGTFSMGNVRGHCRRSMAGYRKYLSAGEVVAARSRRRTKHVAYDTRREYPSRRNMDAGIVMRGRCHVAGKAKPCWEYMRASFTNRASPRFLHISGKISRTGSLSTIWSARRARRSRERLLSHHRNRFAHAEELEITRAHGRIHENEHPRRDHGRPG